MSSNRNLVVRREISKSTAQTPLVLSLKALPVSLRVRSPDVAVRSAVYTVPAHPGSGAPDSKVIRGASCNSDAIRISKKFIKFGSSKGTVPLIGSSKDAQIPVSWKEDETPSDAQLLQLAHQKEPSSVLGFSALHWACELLRLTVVQSIIDRKLVHPDTFAEHKQFISFTPVFSAISVLWLRAEHNSEHGVKDINLPQQEQLCLSIMSSLAAAGARLDIEAEVHLKDIKCVTLLHIAADYACLVQGRAFQQRYNFLLRVAQLLAQTMQPPECAVLLRRRCKVDGRDAVSVQELLESKPLPPKLRANCIAALFSILSCCDAHQTDDVAAAPVPRNAVLAQTRKGRAAASERVPRSKNFSEKKLIPGSRRRMQSESSASLGLFPIQAAGSGRGMKRNAVSSCSESDSESGVLSGYEEAPSSKRGCSLHATPSIASKQPRAASSVVSNQDCETFMASCNRMHMQCKLGCVPGVGVLSASSNSKCASDISCPLCGNPVYSSLANPLAATTHDMQSSMSIHIIRECTGLPCSIGGCSWKGGHSHLPLHIATAHTFS